MKIKEFKNTNITLLFSEKINHDSVSKNDILDLFKTGDKDKDINNFIQAPNFKLFIFPNQKKDIAIEDVRLVVSNKEEKDLKENGIVDDFYKIFETTGYFNKDNVTAYGFNYDFIVEADSLKKVDLIGSEIKEIYNDFDFKKAGVNFSFSDKTVDYSVDIRSTNKENEYFVHFNIHHKSSEIPAKEDLKKELISDFKEAFEKISKL